MKILLIILTFGLSLFASGYKSKFSNLKADIGLTPFSKRILWVKITKKERRAPGTDRGIKYEPFIIEGTIEEVIRGKDKKINWKHTGSVTTIVDQGAASAAYGELFSLHYNKIKLEKEGSDCEVGKYYLVMYFLDTAFFVEAPIKDQTWRKKIQPFSPSPRVEMIERALNR